MELWILLAIAAAIFQTARFTLQKQLSQIKLSASGATFARFVYSAPIAGFVALVYFSQSAGGFPAIDSSFTLFALMGASSQIMATVCTVLLFGRRNFAVGLTFTKVAVLLSAPVGWFLLADTISIAGLIAICVGFSGVLVLSGPIEGTGPWWRRILSPSGALGLAGGALFSVSGVAYRGATLAVQSSDAFERALLTLAIVTAIQMTSMAIWLWLKDKPELGKVLKAWKSAGFIGLTSLAGSFCWFAAYTLQNAAYVNAIGQIEVLMGLGVTVLFFNEKITAREMLGIALISFSVLALIIWG